MTARQAVLLAFQDLQSTTGREAFKPQEIVDWARQQFPEFSERTIRTHVVSRMSGGGHHTVTYEDLERIGRGLYRMTPEGLTAVLAMTRPISRR